MSDRRPAFVLLLLALALYAAVAVPARRRAGDAGEELRRLEAERQDLRKRLAPRERRDAERQRAAAIVSTGAGSRADSLTEVRRAVVAILEGARVSDVHLQVRPGRPPVRVSVQLAADGAFSDLVDLCGRLVRPGSGLILDRLRLTPKLETLHLELDAMSLEARR